MSANKPNPYQLKKELTLTLKQKIGDITFELETKKGSEKAEIHLREDDYYIGSMTLEPYELERVGVFFKNAHEEVKKINEEPR